MGAGFRVRSFSARPLRRFGPDARRQDSEGRGDEPADKPMRKPAQSRERRERSDRRGGADRAGTWRWAGVEGTGGGTAAPAGRPAAGERERGGVEPVPSAGWREVSISLDAVDGRSHR
jgi:hypothetical protein